MLSCVALSSAVALLVFAPLSNAHGHLYEPEPTFMDGKSTVEWVANIDYYWEKVGSGGDQVGIFKTMAKEKNVTVRDVVLEMAPDYPCGYTRTDVDPKAIPTNGLAIWLGNGGGGFTHQGPCEIYLGATMVLHGDNCEDEYPGGADNSGVMSEMPVDYSFCNGDCTLAIYWLAFQNEQWQAYINCVPIASDGTASSTTTSAAVDSSAAATTTAPTTTAAASSQTSASETADEAETTEAATEALATEAPTVESTGSILNEAATSTTTSTCNRRRK